MEPRVQHHGPTAVRCSGSNCAPAPPPLRSRYRWNHWALRVLVVDDDDFMLELVAEQLEQIDGLEVVPVSDGWSALAFVDDAVARPDLIVFDLGLRDIHGTEVMRLLADRKYRGGLVVMSGSSRHVLDAAADIAQGYGLWLVDTVGKPIDPAQLRAASALPSRDHVVHHVAECDAGIWVGESEGSTGAEVPERAGVRSQGSAFAGGHESQPERHVLAQHRARPCGLHGGGLGEQRWGQQWLSPDQGCIQACQSGGAAVAVRGGHLGRSPPWTVHHVVRRVAGRVEVAAEHHEGVVVERVEVEVGDGCGGRPDHVGAARLFGRRNSPPQVGAQRRGGGPQQLARGPSRDPTGDLTHEVAVGVGVVDDSASRLEPGGGAREVPRHDLPPPQGVIGEPAADRRHARPMAQRVPHGGALLAALGELGPYRAHGVVEIQQALVHQLQGHQGDQRLAGGVEVDERVVPPRQSAGAVGGTADEVDHRPVRAPSRTPRRPPRPARRSSGRRHRAPRRMRDHSVRRRGGASAAVLHRST